MRERTWILARSWVPMATSVRCRHRFWCSLSCAARRRRGQRRRWTRQQAGRQAGSTTHTRLQVGKRAASRRCQPGGSAARRGAHLQVNERVVAQRVEGHAAQHGAHHKGPHQRRLGPHHHALHLLACGSGARRAGGGRAWAAEPRRRRSCLSKAAAAAAAAAEAASCSGNGSSGGCSGNGSSGGCSGNGSSGGGGGSEPGQTAATACRMRTPTGTRRLAPQRTPSTLPPPPASAARTRHVCEREARRRLAAAEDVERAGDALQAQHVVAVGGDVDLVDDLLCRCGPAQGAIRWVGQREPGVVAVWGRRLSTSACTESSSVCATGAARAAAAAEGRAGASSAGSRERSGSGAAATRQPTSAPPRWRR